MALKNRTRLAIGIGLAVLFLLLSILTVLGKQEPFHIALVCPLSGEHAPEGESVLNGVRLYLDTINSAGGINGRRIFLDIFDDRNDPEFAAESASEIVDSQALAVIGHYDSSCSVAGGRVYEGKIPAITSASTSATLGSDNEWYFRNINDDRVQGRFLANYFKVFMGTRTIVSIIYEKHPYGEGLANAFADACRELDIEIKYLKEFPADEEFQDLILRDIVEDELALVDDPGIIFLATRAAAGVRLVKLIRDAGIRNPLGGPETFASKIFQEGFSSFPAEKLYPGYYSNQVFVMSSLLFDSANEDAQTFREDYMAEYGDAPGSDAAYAYDAAMVIVEALRKAGIQGNENFVSEDRRKIRDYLANLSSIKHAVKGATGFNYFDENRDARKEIYFGLYKSNHLISTFSQLRNIHYLNEISDIEKAIEKGDVLEVDGKFMYQSKVVKTGVKFNEISEIDANGLTCVLDFNLWFRYQGDFDAQDILFENAVDPIPLDKPIIERIRDDDVYRLYHVRGRFKADFFPERYAFGQHVLGFRFHHRVMTRNKLIFVTDIVGMGLTNGRTPLEKMQAAKVISHNEGCTINSVRLFGNTFKDEPQGRPEYLNLMSGIVEHSAFNAWIRIKDNSFTLRGMITFEYSKMILMTGSVLLLWMAFLTKKINLKKHAKFVWSLRIMIVMILLLASEVYLASQMISQMNNYHLALFTRAFGMCYWIAAAFFLCRAVNYFIWIPLEDRTGRTIPNFLRRFVASVIYLLAAIGIIAFVFDQKVTSLLATSGVFAMIIGLAIQMNISNIFSGIAINMEHPFRIGDWVDIGEFEEGEVIDITWRTTRVRTRDDCVLSIPNSVASESVIKNYHYPNDVYELWFPVYIDPGHSPEQVESILLDAALSADVVLRDPYPIARLSGGLKEWAAKYYVVACVKDRAKMNAYKGIIWKSILTHLHQAGITPARRQEIHLFQGEDSPALPPPAA